MKYSAEYEGSVNRIIDIPRKSKKVLHQCEAKEQLGIRWHIT